MEAVEAEVVEIVREEVPPVASTALVVVQPMQLIEQALTRGAGIDVIDRLMTLQERWEKNQARKAFDEAISAARAEIKPITKNRRVKFASKKEGASGTDYRHEDLAEIARTIDPVLSKHGLSYRFRTHVAPNEPVKVTCIVSHRLGYSEENELSGPRDDSGNKNSLQAIGSAVTYLQRYLLKASLGLAASNDDDGVAAEDDAAGSDELELLQLMIFETKSNLSMFCKIMGVEALPDIAMRDMRTAISKLQEKAAKGGVTFKAETQAKIVQILAKLSGGSA